MPPRFIVRCQRGEEADRIGASRRSRLGRCRPAGMRSATRWAAWNCCGIAGEANLKGKPARIEMCKRLRRYRPPSTRAALHNNAGPDVPPSDMGPVSTGVHFLLRCKGAVECRSYGLMARHSGDPAPFGAGMLNLALNAFRFMRAGMAVDSGSAGGGSDTVFSRRRDRGAGYRAGDCADDLPDF